jgi:hypothetical protein
MGNEKYESHIRIRSDEPIDVSLLVKSGAKFGRVSSVSSDKSFDWRIGEEEE